MGERIYTAILRTVFFLLSVATGIGLYSIWVAHTIILICR